MYSCQVILERSGCIGRCTALIGAGVDSAADAGLHYRRAARLRRRSAEEPGEERDGGV